MSIRLSIEAGYKASTIASWEKQKVLDNSSKYKRIRRKGLGDKFYINGKYYNSRNKISS